MADWVEEAVESASALANKRDTLEHKSDKQTLGDFLVEGGMVIGGLYVLGEVARQVGDSL